MKLIKQINFTLKGLWFVFDGSGAQNSNHIASELSKTGQKGAILVLYFPSPESYRVNNKQAENNSKSALHICRAQKIL